jgi:CheY-like chemotaxis protein
MERIKPRFLVIEDDPDDLFLLESSFSRYGLEADIQIASDGLQALRFVDDFRNSASPLPDLVILDLNLPGVSGLEILRRIRTIWNILELPVVILSSSISLGDVNAARSLGVSGYFEKPLVRDSTTRIREIVAAIPHESRGMLQSSL